MKVRFVIVILFVLALVLAVGADAQNLKKQIVGTWSAVSVVNEQNGKKIEPMGPNPLGQYLFSRDGHFSIQMARPNRSKFASNNRAEGTAEENREAMAGYQASFGTYSVNSDGTLMLHTVASNFPNWDGAEQKRRVQIKGNELTVSNPTGSIGGTTVIVLRRAK
jgi:hypothetical protein